MWLSFWPTSKQAWRKFTEEMKPRFTQFKTSLEMQVEALTILDKEILELLEEKEEVTDEEIANEIEEYHDKDAFGSSFACHN